MIEGCSNFKRAFTKSGNEVSWCSVKGTDMNCGGMSDMCPPKMRKYFKGNVPLNTVTFIALPIIIEGGL